MRSATSHPLPQELADPPGFVARSGQPGKVRRRVAHHQCAQAHRSFGTLPGLVGASELAEHPGSKRKLGHLAPAGPEQQRLPGQLSHLLVHQQVEALGGIEIELRTQLGEDSSSYRVRLTSSPAPARRTASSTKSRELRQVELMLDDVRLGPSRRRW